jgi:predicted transcriptional regulator
VALNSRIFENRLVVKRVLQRAHVPASTWWRWVTKGSDPRRETLGKIERAIDSLIAEKDATDGSTSRHSEDPQEEARPTRGG